MSLPLPPDDNTLFQRFQNNCGVNFSQLKQKYENMTNAEVSLASTPSTMSSMDNKPMQSANDCLNKYVICRDCNGAGVIKYIYNHMAMQKTCELCDGDSVVLSEFVANLSLPNSC